MRATLFILAVLLAPSDVRADEWKDPSPHKSEFVKVNGVRLNYLDWGGRGPALIFLAGMGSSPHVFDDLAPRFTDRFRVVGLTRRGTGASERPESGYTLDNLVEDLKGFLDSLGIQRASFAGHSLGGDEITAFAVKYSDRVDRIVYLDGAFNRSKEFNAAIQEKLKNAPKDPLLDRVSKFFPGPSAMTSIDSLKEWYVGNGWKWKASVEAAVRDCWLKEGKLSMANGAHPASGPSIIQSIQAAPPNFNKIKAPVLSLVALRKVHPAVRPADSEDLKKQAAAAWEYFAMTRRVHAEYLKQAVPTARIIEIEGDHGQFFHEREEEVYREMREFLTAS